MLRSYSAVLMQKAPMRLHRGFPNGDADGARTHDLRRDSVTLKGKKSTVFAVLFSLLVCLVYLKVYPNQSTKRRSAQRFARTSVWAA
jgi:hypothetical protein